MMHPLNNRKNNLQPRTRFWIVLMMLALSACGSDLGDELGARKVGVKIDRNQTPAITSTTPANKAKQVPTNTKLAAYFSVAMDPLSGAVFTLKQGNVQIPGTVATTNDGMAATFAPSSNLVTNTVLTATISTGAKSADGIALAAARSWSFTTGTAADTTAPTVSSTFPLDNASDVVLNTKIAATFSKAMDPLSINPASFTVTQADTRVEGIVTYGPGTIAAFTPAHSLVPNALYTVTLNGDNKDLAGNALASTLVWQFTTGSIKAKGPAPVLLGTASDYVILAKTAISTVPGSALTGDIGISPAAASYLTGFSLVADATNVFSRSTQIIGKAYAADYAVPSPVNLTTAISNMETAYTDGQGRPTPDHLELGSGNIGGLTLAPGLYKWTSTVIMPADVTLKGGANDVWIFQTSGDLAMDSAKRIILSGGAQAKNVFWLVAGYATLGTGSHFEGILLSKTQVTVLTGATMNGRILAQTQVALQKATVTEPAK